MSRHCSVIPHCSFVGYAKKRYTPETQSRYHGRPIDRLQRAAWYLNGKRPSSQYQVDRANVAENHRVAALLLQDASDGKPARMGVLDVGGATLEDVTAWSVWQDTSASHRGSGLVSHDGARPPRSSGFREGAPSPQTPAAGTRLPE